MRLLRREERGERWSDGSGDDGDGDGESWVSINAINGGMVCAQSAREFTTKL